MSKQWELWADTTVGRLNDIMRQLGYHGWSAYANGQGAYLAVPSDGPMPDGLDQIVQALRDRGIDCNLS